MTLKKAVAEAAKQTLPSEKYQVTHKGDQTQIWSISSEIRTVEDALAKAEIDAEL